MSGFFFFSFFFWGGGGRGGGISDTARKGIQNNKQTILRPMDQDTAVNVSVSAFLIMAVSELS